MIKKRTKAYEVQVRASYTAYEAYEAKINRAYEA